MIETRKIETIVKPFLEFAKDNPVTNTDNYIQTMNSEEEQQYRGNHSNEQKTTLYGCNAGMYSYTITWDGKLIGCQLLGDCWTYPFDTGLQQAWDDYPEKVVLPPLPEKCIRCKTSCTACPATRLAETGHINGLPDYLCRESRLASESSQRLIDEIKNIIVRKDEDYESL